MKRSVSKKSKHNPPPSSFTLDPDAIMRSMLAARKQGKQKEVSEESGSDNEDGSSSDDTESQSRRQSSGSSISGEDRQKRSRSSSTASSNTHRTLEDVVKAVPSVSSMKAVASSTSRVTISNRVQSNKLKTPSLPQISKPSPTTSFASLGLSQPLISALATINIKTPTEIQAACVGPILSGHDCIGGAKTGSGKTMAFALPILERIARDPFGVFAVVLTPTRELAYQLTEQFLVVGRPLGLTTITIVGGMDTLTQAQELDARPHVVVATPGRLCDLLRSDGMGVGKLSRVRVLVLDEADRLLTPTFAPELSYLFSQIPSKRQTCLFTATVSDAIMKLANKPPAPGKETPFVYRVESEIMTVANLKQRYLFIPSQIRDSYLYYLLLHPPDLIDAALRLDPKKQEEPKTNGREGRKTKKPKEETAPPPRIPSTIIFAQRCATAHLLHLLLKSLDIPSAPLHSHLTQPQRLQSLAQFRAAEVPVLVTTDVGSRGLDIPEVAMVINWDCPRRADDYVHRVGRTARAGRGGLAITIITERDVELVKNIEDEVKVKLEELVLPEEEVLESLNTVSVARRVATMEMHDSGFGERQATNKAKQIKRMRRDTAK